MEMNVGQVIDIFTGRPINASERDWGFAMEFDCPPQKQLIFDIDRLPNRMVRIAATVPGEFTELMSTTWHRVLLESGKVKPKPTKRRAYK
jgi:hypothetical protein